MRIHNLKINHITNPLGYWYKTVSASYLVDEAEGQVQESARIRVAEDIDFAKIVFDTGRSKEVSCTGTPLQVALKPRTRYYWKVQVWDELGNEGESCLLYTSPSPRD